MATALSTYANGRDNNFNLLRFIAACLVLFSHSFALVWGRGTPEPLKALLGMTWGSIAVDIFFITSGFLITASYLSRNNLLAFAWARILRIYPALVAATLFCVLVVGISFTTIGTREFLSHQLTLTYLAKNVILFFGVQDMLPGVFLDLPYRGAVNGSLWTLPVEVRMYALLACILGLAGWAGKRVAAMPCRNVVLAIAIFSIGLNICNDFRGSPLGHDVRLFSMFFVGAAFYVWRDRVRLYPAWAILGLIVLLLSSMSRPLFFLAYCLVLPFLVFYAAYVPAGLVREFNRLGDYSYGIYIYAFPVQQSLIHMVPAIKVPVMMIASLLITLLLAILSWHLIEKRCLQWKGAYVLVEGIAARLWMTMRCSKD